MKQIPWDFFAQRRNISYTSFKNMSYEQYVRWCARRNVIPLEESLFLDKTSPKKVQIDTKPKALPPNPRNTDPKLLAKKKKAELVELCTLRQLEITGKETKKQLVALLTEQSP